ncbi:MAG TPA: hypothetical protein VGI40_14085 [Pirellulaceae bacterium]|jgi:phage anti-repressor protein
MAKSKARRALEFVRRAASRAESGTDLHNAFFGIGGQFGKLFPTRPQREAFVQTPEYQEIVQIQDDFDERPRQSTSKRPLAKNRAAG